MAKEECCEGLIVYADADAIARWSVRRGARHGGLLKGRWGGEVWIFRIVLWCGMDAGADCCNAFLAYAITTWERERVGSWIFLK